MELIRVVLADDDGDIRDNVGAIVTSVDDIVVVAEAATGPDAIAATDRHHPDVVLMDIRMPGGGLEATEMIRAAHPGVAVVILTTFGEDEYVDRALRLGVSGFLLKTSDPTELIRGVCAAAAGGAILSPRIAARLIHHVGQHVPDPSRISLAVKHLTPREREVLSALAQGMSNAEIAVAQHLTEGTVKGYVSALFVRLGVRNRVEAAILAHQEGLLQHGLRASPQPMNEQGAPLHEPS